METQETIRNEKPAQVNFKTYEYDRYCVDHGSRMLGTTKSGFMRQAIRWFYDHIQSGEYYRHRPPK